MAIRKIVTYGDDILRKKCKPVTEFDERLHTLLDDLKDTLIDSNGVGLAAPQVGVMRRICVVDNGDRIVELINPEIIKKSGKERGVEGCLSFPKKFGYVTRPTKCTVKAFDRDGKEFVINMVTPLSARCACHEVDHLDGVLFVDLVEEYIDSDDE